MFLFSGGVFFQMVFFSQMVTQKSQFFIMVAIHRWRNAGNRLHLEWKLAGIAQL